MRHRNDNGFTLIELIVVILLAAIVAGVLGTFIARPMQGYVDLSRRAELVDAAQAALQRMTRDVRRALPNSIRIGGGGTVLEMINAPDGARYRDDPPGNNNQRLTFSSADAQFNLLGMLNEIGTITNSTQYRLVVYHTGDPGANAYAGDDVITPSGRQITITVDSGVPSSDDEHHIDVGGGGHQFALESPTQRIFAVDTPVTYHCDETTDNDVLRFWGYPIQDPQLTTRGGLRGEAGVQEALLTEHVTSCRFTYQSGTSERAGLVTLELELSDEGETISLLQQVHVPNAP